VLDGDGEATAAPPPPAEKREAPATKKEAAPPKTEQKTEAKSEEPEEERESAAEEEAEPQATSSPRPAAAMSKPQRPQAPPAEKPTAAGDDEDRVKASPLARKIAQERGIDLSGVTGSGPGGRIVERDVEQATPKRPAAGEPAARPRAVPAASKPEAPAATRIELGKMRRTTARRMAEAKRDIPHFYATSDIAMDECVRLKEGLAALEGEYTGITYTHLVLKAVGVGLRRVPEMNASLDGETLVLHDTVHVGLATATDDGLIVPVVRDCDRQPLGALVVQTRALIERARAGKFAADDLRGATFTVSNLGMYPVSHFAAVVNPPQVAILAVGAVREVAVVRDGSVTPGHVMSVTLSCDHRAVDGALAGRFLKELHALLKSPLALVA